MNSKTRRNSGFTLMELMLVVVIIGIMVGMVMPRLLGTRKRPGIDSTRAQLHSLDAVLYAYRMEVGTFPTDDQGLRALIEDPGVDGWNGPYLVKGIPLDAWGNPYVYRVDPQGGADYDLFSCGPDGKEGTEDDRHSAGGVVEDS